MPVTDVNRQIEAQLKAMEEKTDFLMRRYDSYIGNAAEIYEQIKGRKMSDHQKRNLAVCLENTKEVIEKARFMEQTYTSDVSFTNYAFDIVAVIVSSLIAEEIVSVQAMDRRSADIFYMSMLVDQTKGKFTKGDTIIHPKTGWLSNTRFASGWIDEEVIGAGTGSATNFTGNTDYTMLEEGATATITDGVETGTGTVTSGNVTFAGDVTGTLTGATGAFDVDFGTAPLSTVPVLLTYKVNLEKDPTAIAKVKYVIDSENIKAETFKLNAEWLMDAAYDLLKAHGKDAEKEVLVQMTGEIRAEIDSGIIMDLYNNAGDTAASWDKTPPATSVPWIWHKNSFIDALIAQSSTIFANTRRCVGNFVTLGLNVADVVESLDQFKSDMAPNTEISGPYYAGMLSNRWKVYVSPDIPANNWVQGYIGESYLKSGYVYAPYLPVFTTPTYTTKDFIVHKGIGSSFGTHLVNNKMYARGTMTES